MKPDGWKKYAELTNEKSLVFSEIVNDKNRCIETVVEDVENGLNKIKYSAFGKTTIRKKKTKCSNEAQNPVTLLQKQNDRVEHEINELKKMNSSKSTKIFKIAERIRGPKGAVQEPTAVKNPKTGETVVSTKGIKEVVLDYYTEVLTNN